MSLHHFQQQPRRVADSEHGQQQWRPQPSTRTAVHADGYAWVKYGEKKLTPSKMIREYYRCKNWRDSSVGGTGCQAKKVVDRPFLEDQGEGDVDMNKKGREKKARAVFPRHSPSQSPEYSQHNHHPPSRRGPTNNPHLFSPPGSMGHPDLHAGQCAPPLLLGGGQDLTSLLDLQPPLHAPHHGLLLPNPLSPSLQQSSCAADMRSAADLMQIASRVGPMTPRSSLRDRAMPGAVPGAFNAAAISRALATAAGRDTHLGPVQPRLQGLAPHLPGQWQQPSSKDYLHQGPTQRQSLLQSLTREMLGHLLPPPEPSAGLAQDSGLTRAHLLKLLLLRARVSDASLLDSNDPGASSDFAPVLAEGDPFPTLMARSLDTPFSALGPCEEKALSPVQLPSPVPFMEPGRLAQRVSSPGSGGGALLSPGNPSPRSAAAATPSTSTQSLPFTSPGLGPQALFSSLRVKKSQSEKRPAGCSLGSQDREVHMPLKRERAVSDERGRVGKKQSLPMLSVPCGPKDEPCGWSSWPDSATSENGPLLMSTAGGLPQQWSLQCGAGTPGFESGDALIQGQHERSLSTSGPSLALTSPISGKGASASQATTSEAKSRNTDGDLQIGAEDSPPRQQNNLNLSEFSDDALVSLISLISKEIGTEVAGIEGASLTDALQALS